MKRARDIQDQLEGLLTRVEIEVNCNLNDLDAIKFSKLYAKDFFVYGLKPIHHTFLYQFSQML